LGRKVLGEVANAARDGCTEAILLAHGFTVAQMVELVRSGLATAHSQRVVVGRKAHRLCPNMWPLAMLFVQRRHG
jgi:hypothetical protein